MSAFAFTPLRTVTRLLAFAALTLSSVAALAANYPLELASPRAVGTAPASGNAAISAGNRIFKAYPNIEYNIRAVVVGGAYPYTFSLSNAPAGMTINPATGEIRWPSPTGSSATPTITVRDSEGTTRSSPWTIAVTTEGFKFVDAVNGRNHPTGTGTLANPWRSVADVQNASSAASSDIVYFRAGTYQFTGIPLTSTGPWGRFDYTESKPNIWIAYPGSTPVLDFANGGLIRLRTGNMYIDGFETRNSRVIGFQLAAGNYNVLRRLRMRDHNLARVDLDGSNAAFIMTMSHYSDSGVGGNSGTWAQYLAIQDNEFINAPMDMGLKIYSTWKMLIEDNTFRDSSIGAELKADMAQFTYRHNEHYNTWTKGVGGNMHSLTTHGEINFNLIHDHDSSVAMDINQDGMAKRIDIYRNTVVGRVRVRNTDAADGPFRFYDNVLINSEGATRIDLENVSAVTQVITRDNLTASSGVVDSTGSLTSQYSQYVGTRGWEVGNVVRPSAPTALSVQ